MPINANDIRWYYPQNRSDAGTNGGRMTAELCPSGIEQNVWPHVDEAERTAGSDKYRKLFHKIENADNGGMPSARSWLRKPSPGDDSIYIFPATQTDIQSNLSGTEPLCGAGVLDASVSAGATNLDVLVEDWAGFPIFRNGDLIAIHTDSELIEFATIDAAPNAVGNVITLTLATALANSFVSGSAWVSSVIQHGTLQASAGSVVVNSAAGTFDAAQMILNHRGAIEQVLTLTFTNASDYTATSDVLGGLGAGNISSTFAPVNPDFGVEYLQIPAGAWGGVFANGDSVDIPLSPAAAPIWERRIVPSAATTIAVNNREIVLWGQSAA